MFILVLEAVYCVIKSNKNIKGLSIFNDEFLYTAYAGDTLFLKVKISVFKTLHSFLCFFGISPNTAKCEIAGIGTLKGVNVALCGMKCLNLMKILGVHFFYYKKLEHGINFQSHVVKIEGVLRLWRMRNVTIEVFSNFQNSPSITYNYGSVCNN